MYEIEIKITIKLNKTLTTSTKFIRLKLNPFT